MSPVIKQIADQVTRQTSTKLRLFPSHAWAHGHRRQDLHEILRPWKRGTDFEDYSVSCAHPIHTKSDRALAKYLSNIIRHMDALLVMAGMYANNSDWMGFEIHAAVIADVPIIPILDNGQQRIPTTATQFASCEPVRWRSQSIHDAIRSCLSPARRQEIETAARRRANFDKIEY